MDDCMSPIGKARLAAFRADSEAMVLLRHLLKRCDSADIWMAAIDVEIEREQAEKRPKRKKASRLPDNTVRLDEYR